MIVVLDTETTGLPNESRASVIEVGAVCVDFTGQEVSAFSALVKPPHVLGDWCAKAMAANGVDPALLDIASEPDVVWEALLIWMRLHKPVTQVLAYNVAFDKEMMRRTFPISVHLPWGPCLMEAAAQHIHGPKRKRLALAEAMEHINYPYAQNHRALDDARAAAAVGTFIMKARQTG